MKRRAVRKRTVLQTNEVGYGSRYQHVVFRSGWGLDDKEALALAQFVKRLTWSDLRGCAVDDDEAYVIKDAVDKLQRAMAEEGFSPR